MRTSLAIVAGFTIPALLMGAGNSPALQKLQVAAFALAALGYGFGSVSPRVPGWMRHQAVRGVACVYLGCGALFLPPQFIVSAFFIGCGVRMVSTCGQTGASSRDIVLRTQSREVTR